MSTAKITTHGSNVVGWNSVPHNTFVKIVSSLDQCCEDKIGCRYGNHLILLEGGFFSDMHKLISYETWRFEILPKGTEILITV